MIKKVVMAMVGAMLAGSLFMVSSIDAQAALSCTYDIINDANSNISSATAGYQAAKADEAAKLANLNAVKANPAHSQLEYEQAVFAYNNAVNVSAWWLAQINNSQEFLKNIKGREAFEDKFAANREALADLTTLRASKTDADGAANIANGVLAQIQDVEMAIAGYQIQVAACPSLQPQLDALNARLAALKADYAVKSAAAAEKAGVFANNVNTLNYKAFSLGFDNYQYNREIKRGDVDWNPKGYY